MSETSTPNEVFFDELPAPLRKVIELERKENALPQANELAEAVDLTDTPRQMARNAHEPIGLISAMLDSNRLEADQRPVEFQVISVPPLTGEISNELLDVSPRSQPEFSWHTGSDPPPAYSDPGKLKTALTNLAGDVVQFALRGRGTVDARIRHGRLEMVVGDTGIGILEKALALFCEPFRLLLDPGACQFGGTGLALHIVRRFSDTLNRKVSVASRVGRGSRLRIWLSTETFPENPAV